MYNVFILLISFCMMVIRSIHISANDPVSFLSMAEKYWNGFPFPTPGDLLTPGIKPTSLESPALAGRFFITAPPRKPCCCIGSHFLGPVSPAILDIQYSRFCPQLLSPLCHSAIYRHSLLYFTLQITHFLQIKVLQRPCIEQVYQHHFSNSIYSLGILISHFHNF